MITKVIQKKPKTVNLRGIANEHPITWTLSKKGSEFYDHIERKYLNQNMQVSVR